MYMIMININNMINRIGYIFTAVSKEYTFKSSSETAGDAAIDFIDIFTSKFDDSRNITPLSTFNFAWCVGFDFNFCFGGMFSLLILLI